MKIKYRSSSRCTLVFIRFTWLALEFLSGKYVLCSLWTHYEPWYPDKRSPRSVNLTVMTPSQRAAAVRYLIHPLEHWAWEQIRNDVSFCICHWLILTRLSEWVANRDIVSCRGFSNREVRVSGYANFSSTNVMTFTTFLRPPKVTKNNTNTAEKINLPKTV